MNWEFGRVTMQLGRRLRVCGMETRGSAVVQWRKQQSHFTCILKEQPILSIHRTSHGDVIDSLFSLSAEYITTPWCSHVEQDKTAATGMFLHFLSLLLLIFLCFQSEIGFKFPKFHFEPIGSRSYQRNCVHSIWLLFMHNCEYYI